MTGPQPESHAPASHGHPLFEPRWYACQVMSRSEKKVAHLLTGFRIASFLPLMAVTRQWKDRKRTVELPLFPGYVFGRFTLDDYGMVLRIPRLATVVRINDAPAPIPDDEIENIRRFEERLRLGGVEPEPVRRFVEGQRVRVLAEPFLGAVEGIVIERPRGRYAHVFIGVHLIGQFLRIRVKATDLEPLDPT